MERTELLNGLMESKYYFALKGGKDSEMNLALLDVEKRINELEDRVYKKKRTITRIRQVLILDFIGVINSLSNLNISRKKRASLLAGLLNVDASNLEQDLAIIENNSGIVGSMQDYRHIADFFESIGLEDLATKAEKMFIKLKVEREI